MVEGRQRACSGRGLVPIGATVLPRCCYRAAPWAHGQHEDIRMIPSLAKHGPGWHTDMGIRRVIGNHESTTNGAMTGRRTAPTPDAGDRRL